MITQTYLHVHQKRKVMTPQTRTEFDCTGRTEILEASLSLSVRKSTVTVRTGPRLGWLAAVGGASDVFTSTLLAAPGGGDRGHLRQIETQTRTGARAKATAQPMTGLGAREAAISSLREVFNFKQVTFSGLSTFRLGWDLSFGYERSGMREVL